MWTNLRLIFLQFFIIIYALDMQLNHSVSAILGMSAIYSLFINYYYY